jgi:hypothetical protein
MKDGEGEMSGEENLCLFASSGHRFSPEFSRLPSGLADPSYFIMHIESAMSLFDCVDRGRRLEENEFFKDRQTIRQIDRAS